MRLQDKCTLGARSFGFNLFRSLRDIEVSDPSPRRSVDELMFNPGMDKSLFDEVFSVDPDSKLPVGDLAMFVNENTHPDIKRFIELNLLKPYDVKSDSSGDFSSLSDDDIVEFTRGVDESIISYRDRILNVIRNERVNVQKSASEA